MKLSVILPCRDDAATIAVQLDALCHQHWPGGWEVLVVSNAATNEAKRIVRRYQHRLPGLLMVEVQHPGDHDWGVPHAYNCGIRFATGDAFVFCEADKEVAPGWLQAMGQALQAHAFVAARLDHRKLNPPWLQPLKGEGYQSAGLSQMRGYPWLAHAAGCSLGLRREVIDRAGPLNVDYAWVHDTEFSWRAQLAGFDIHLEPSALVHYREKASFGARFREGRGGGRDYIKLLQHYGAPLPSHALARKLVALGRVVVSGLPLWLGSRSEPVERSRALADWFWNLGWAAGETLALLRDPPVPMSNVLARAAALQASRRRAESLGAAAGPQTTSS